MYRRKIVRNRERKRMYKRENRTEKKRENRRIYILIKSLTCARQVGRDVKTSPAKRGVRVVSWV